MRLKPNTPQFRLTPVGSLSGPGSSTDNAIVRWDGTSGGTLQDSPATINDAGGIATTIASGGNSVGLTVTQNDTVNNPRGVSIVNTGTGNTLFIDPNGNASASTSVGGAILLENTGNSGAGMIIYSNFGSGATGRLLNVRADNAAFDQDAVHIDNDGVGDALSITCTAAASNAITATSSGVDHTLAVSYTGSTANKGAASLSSTSIYTTLSISGQETGQGTIKATNTYTGSDNSNAAVLSLDRQGTGTSCQGIFIDSTASGGSSGKILNLRNAGVEYLTLTSDGRLYGAAIHNNAGSVTGTTNQYITSGTYTPSLTAVANVAASTAYACQWMRVGNVVTVSGKADVDPTLTATSTQLGISLPIASNIAAAENCSGTAFAPGIASQGAAILGDAGNDRAQMQWVAGDVTNQAMYFTFTYVVL